MFESNTLARVQAALQVGQQVAYAATGNGDKPFTDRGVEARLVTDVARLVLEEDDRQRHRLIIPSVSGR